MSIRFELASSWIGDSITSSIHVLTNATDQDEVAAADVDEHAKDEFGDETVEQANGVLEDDDLAGNKDRKASLLVLYVLLISKSATREKMNGLTRSTDRKR